MDREELIDLIEQCLIDQSPIPPSSLNEHTALYGDDGLLDSLGLVTLTLEVESRVNERMHASITLVDDEAMVMNSSPFRTVGSLADHIMLSLGNASRTRA